MQLMFHPSIKKSLSWISARAFSLCYFLRDVSSLWIAFYCVCVRVGSGGIAFPLSRKSPERRRCGCWIQERAAPNKRGEGDAKLIFQGLRLQIARHCAQNVNLGRNSFFTRKWTRVTSVSRKSAHTSIKQKKNQKRKLNVFSFQPKCLIFLFVVAFIFLHVLTKTRIDNILRYNQKNR